MAMGDLARTDEYDPFDAEKFANPAVAGAIGALATLPQRAIQNSQFAVNTGVYDPATPVEAAMTVMGGGVGGTGERAGVAFGSGPIRKAPDIPSELYHVAGPEYTAGSPLRSLYNRKGNAAYDEYAARWPEAGDLVQYHPHQNFFYDKLDDAAGHADAFGGKVMKIDPKKVEGLNFDKNEGFWTTREDVGPEAFLKDKDVTLGSGATDKKGAAAIQGIRAYHSSPHDFDRFDLSKIGTGEGAQVYGHGLYFAENPAVSGQGGQYWQNFLGHFGADEQRAAGILNQKNFNRAAAVKSAKGGVDEAAEYLAGSVSQAGKANWEQILRERQAQYDLLTKGGPVGPRTYEVSINADPAHMLDWDNKLPMNSPARAKLYELGEKGMKYHEGGIDRQFAKDSILSAQNELLTGEGALRMMGKAVDQARPIMKAEGDPYALFGSLPAMSSRMLNEAGIPGIKYLDEGSRNARPVLKTDRAGNVISSEYAPPTHNFVVFDPSIVRIDKKYAFPLAAGAGGMGALAATGNYQPEERY